MPVTEKSEHRGNCHASSGIPSQLNYDSRHPKQCEPQHPIHVNCKQLLIVVQPRLSEDQIWP
jgi:hypothetical protein